MKVVVFPGENQTASSTRDLLLQLPFALTFDPFDGSFTLSGLEEADLVRIRALRPSIILREIIRS